MTRLFPLPLWTHGAVTLATFGLFQAAKARLDASYAASGHPVDYATGQLSFDATTIEGYYRVMQDSGTLGVYWQTQRIDFGSIASVMLLALILGTLLARMGGWARGLGLAAAVLGLAGGALDAVENLLSFWMLARPEAIPQALAVAYSSAAAVKFALLTAAMAAALAALVAAAVRRVMVRVG